MIKKHKMSVHFSSEQEDWSTPRWFFRKLDKEFGFELDGAASAKNALCDVFYTKEDNSLLKDWGKRKVWLNPPYGRILWAFMQKARMAAEAGATVCALVPARTDTDWFHEYVFGYAEIRLVRGRLYFGGSENAAPFPSMACIFRPEKSETLFGEVIVAGDVDMTLDAPEFGRVEGRLYAGDLTVVGEREGFNLVRKPKRFGRKEKERKAEQVDIEEILIRR